MLSASFSTAAAENGISPGMTREEKLKASIEAQRQEAWQETDIDEEEIDEDSDILEELVEQNAAGELTGELAELVDAIVGMETRVQDNVNVVYMTDISEEMQEAY